MSFDSPEHAARTERNIKRIAVVLLLLVAVTATAFSIYLLLDKRNVNRALELERIKAEAQDQGYATALQQLVDASEQNRELTLTVGERTVRLIVVTPAETPAPPEVTP